ncbi:hypothetical protein AVEN_99759-1 [Araneus ventricosus]|uniref:Uncharacterized protein n=1 Tax=Araneus ventricosus TaxID=182803 RepID=A0A4Y2DKY6_ARAVE|nr:hypothetical protein AVEN_99759-1 [Araneus ventricosus]
MSFWGPFLGQLCSLYTQNRNILVRWIKAHVGYRGNEEAEKAITEGVGVIHKNSFQTVDSSEMNFAHAILGFISRPTLLPSHTESKYSGYMDQSPCWLSG